MAASAEHRLTARAVLVVASLAAVLAAAALAMALVFDPPSLMWIGFAALSLAVVALRLAATLAVPRSRVSAPMPKAQALAALKVEQVVVPASLPAEPVAANV